MRKIWLAARRPGAREAFGRLSSGIAGVSAMVAFLAGCSSSGSSDSGRADASADAPPAHVSLFCDLPGSVQFTDAGKVTVPGGTGSDVVTFLQLPAGFCAHYFATIRNARQMRFAPGGELFVASPTSGTTSNGAMGRSAIVVLPDDGGDGVADEPLTFLGNLPSTQGLLFANGFFYYQDHTKILRTAYSSGDRTPRGPSEEVIDVNVYSSLIHWPKTLDQADDGTIYVGNGGDQDEACDMSRPFRGGILKIDGSPNGMPVSKGFRNPINVRCQHGHNHCFATELSMDYTKDEGGREKLVPIRDGDDWGHPCCFARDIPAFGLNPRPDCSGMTPEDVSFVIGDTPFGVDFEAGMWREPYTQSAFIVLHGAYGMWEGARVVMVDINPENGLPLPGTSISGMAPGAMTDFATGWDDGMQSHGRPSALTFAPDGRLFVANDQDGNIFWVAPMELAR
jgi:glucose/arabinose dehydrogenase